MRTLTGSEYFWIFNSADLMNFKKNQILFYNNRFELVKKMAHREVANWRVTHVVVQFWHAFNQFSDHCAIARDASTTIDSGFGKVRCEVSSLGQ